MNGGTLVRTITVSIWEFQDQESELRKIAVFIAVVAMLGVAATGARAEVIQLGKHSVAEVRSACGASFTVHADGGGYGCQKSCKGSDGKQGTCAVACDNNNNCNGQTPDRTSPGTGTRNTTDLNAVLANRVATEAPPQRQAPTGLGTSKPAPQRQ